MLKARIATGLTQVSYNADAEYIVTGTSSR
jgi:hypothetical protein